MKCLQSSLATGLHRDHTSDVVCRQKRADKMSLAEVSRAVEDHFNGTSWDRRLGLKLAPPTYDHRAPGAPEPPLRRRRRREISKWDRSTALEPLPQQRRRGVA